MFERLFTRRSAITHHYAAPLVEERLRYLVHCAHTGVRRETLRVIAAHQASLICLLDLREGERVHVARVEAAAKQWSLPGGRHSPRAARAHARQRFFGHAVRWLRFLNLLDEPRATQHSHADKVAVFAAWGRDERGWSEDTVRGCCHTVDRFFDWLDPRGGTLASVTMTDIDEALARYRARHYSRVTVHDYAQRLRAFFRFAEQQRWCTPGLAEGIMAPRFDRGETIAKGLNRDEVLRLLATTEGDRPADLRDRAILMLLITYGLRCGEVTGLRLDAVNWEEETLRVRCPKPGRTRLYPLSRGVGQSIVRYLREVRPARADRSLFLTLNAPIRPLSRNAITHMVSSRVARLAITGKRRGPHALRHAAAQHLLDQGLSMKEVGDYLGHRSVSATSAYAKVQLHALREVADIDLEGLT